MNFCFVIACVTMTMNPLNNDCESYFFSTSGKNTPEQWAKIWSWQRDTVYSQWTIASPHNFLNSWHAGISKLLASAICWTFPESLADRNPLSKDDFSNLHASQGSVVNLKTESETTCDGREPASFFEMLEKWYLNFFFKALQLQGVRKQTVVFLLKIWLDKIFDTSSCWCGSHFGKFSWCFKTIDGGAGATASEWRKGC